MTLANVEESGRDYSQTSSYVSDEAAALLGDQQFEMYEYTGERHEKIL